MLTDFPKKSLPSMMTLTFLNPILEREREVEESGTVYVVNRLQGNLRLIETSDIWLVFEGHRYGRC